MIGDFRPSGGRYRISAGLVFGNDRIDNVAREQSPFIRVGTVSIRPAAPAKSSRE